MDESYAERGTEVILGRHKRETVFGTDFCSPEMDPYVGRAAIIKESFLCGDGCLCCYVDIDDGVYYWRVEDMILASDVPLLTPEQKIKLGIKP